MNGTYNQCWKSYQNDEVVSKVYCTISNSRGIGLVAYEIQLPPQLVNLHNVLHVLQLRKYISNSNHVLELDQVHIRDDPALDVNPL